jgi:hypothetical protein
LEINYEYITAEIYRTCWRTGKNSEQEEKDEGVKIFYQRKRNQEKEAN